MFSKCFYVSRGVLETYTLHFRLVEFVDCSRALVPVVINW